MKTSSSPPKGKVGKPVEFGDKLRVDMSRNGYVTNFKVYKGNPADVTMLEDCIKEHHKAFKDTFKAAMILKFNSFTLIYVSCYGIFISLIIRKKSGKTCTYDMNRRNE